MKLSTKLFLAAIGTAVFVGITGAMADDYWREKRKKESKAEYATTPIFNGKPIEKVGNSHLERAQRMLVKLDNYRENVIYSPLSLEFALSLVAEGSSGETLSELLAFTDMLLPDEVKSYMDSLPDGVEIGNGMWLDDKLSLGVEFRECAEKMYKAVSDLVDLSDLEGTCQRINSWCNEQTHGLIPEIVTPASIHAETKLILCNSLYFKSAWFKAWSGNCEAKFECADGYISTVDMLYSTDAGDYLETDNAVAFVKGYENGCSFIGILPHEGVKFEEINLKKLLSYKSNDVFVVEAMMPPLDISYTNKKLVEALKSLGVVDAFGDDASFESMLVGDVKDVHIGDIIQKCKLTLDKNGTEAAAVTETMMIGKACVREPKKVLKQIFMTRPFYYLIMDDKHERVLFIGSVNNV